MPVTKPVVETTLAVPAALLLQLPPAVISLSCVVRPEHTSRVPVIIAGSGFTVTTTVDIQPVGKLYVIVAVRAVVPVAVPVTSTVLPVAKMETTEVLLLLQVPDGVTSLRLVVEPWQTLSIPNIDPGSGFTVTTAVAVHPVGNV